jgi:hypothetical protein
MSLLELAISMKDANTTSMLVNKGADLNVHCKAGIVLSKTMYLACNTDKNIREQWTKIAISMIHRGANIHSNIVHDSPICRAIFLAHIYGDRSLLELILSNGVNINMIIKMANGRDYSTPLLYAIHDNCNGGDLLLVKLLVEKGGSYGNRRRKCNHWRTLHNKSRESQCCFRSY